MINPGQTSTLVIARQSEPGIYLSDDEGNEVLLPNRYVPLEATEGWAIGDKIEVFVYMDSEDRIVATTERPLLEVGQLAALRVVSTTAIGAFLDWGLPKDLLVPFSNQPFRLRVGDVAMVGAYVDRATGRIVGTTRIGKYFSNELITVAAGDKVDIVVAQRRERGYRVIINNAHWGMLYDSQIFSNISIGDKIEGWVTKITEDGRIDVSAQQQGFDQVKVAADAIKAMLIENGGTINLGDKTSPEDISLHTGMSKKVFKRAVGFLMRAGIAVGGDLTTTLNEEIKTL